MKFCYTGRGHDGYYRARYYDAARGRFASEDPIGSRGGINLFVYARNNPTGFTDASGLDVWLEGPAPGEPSGHLSINVGDPNGAYRSYSFGLNGNGYEGEVYRDTAQGGDILPDRYLNTTPDFDRVIANYLEGLVGQKAPYRPWRTCRTFSIAQLEHLRALGFGQLAPPPTRNQSSRANPAIQPPLTVRPLASDTTPWP